MASEASVIRLGKLDAACRQLRTAITLWFTDGDPVSTHALVFAAYEVLHTLSKKRDPNRRDLLFDSDLIKDEYRSDFNKLLKRHAYFFKHADRNSDAIIEFDPEINEWFILYATLARSLCGEPNSEEESAFLWWFHIHRPDALTEEGRKMIADRIPVDALEDFRRLSKRKFFETTRDARMIAQGLSPVSGRRYFRIPT